MRTAVPDQENICKFIPTWWAFLSRFFKFCGEKKVYICNYVIYLTFLIQTWIVPAKFSVCSGTDQPPLSPQSTGFLRKAFKNWYWIYFLSSKLICKAQLLCITITMPISINLCIGLYYAFNFPWLHFSLFLPPTVQICKYFYSEICTI